MPLSGDLERDADAIRELRGAVDRLSRAEIEARLAAHEQVLRLRRVAMAAALEKLARDSQETAREHLRTAQTHMQKASERFARITAAR